MEGDDKLLDYFSTRIRYDASYTLYPGVVITDVNKFVDSHMTIVHDHPHEIWADAYRERLIDFKKLLENYK